MNTPVSQVEKQQQFERPSVVPMNYEAWLALPDHVHTAGLVEWVNNEAIFHMPPNLNHQDIGLFLAQLLGLFADFFKLGKVLISPAEVKLPNNTAREPDIFFVANAHLDRITAQRVEGAPDLIIENISPESAGRDRDDKFDEYQDAGVREYWLVDPWLRRQQVLFYQLGSEGLFKLTSLDHGIYRSAVLPNFWLNPDWLWQLPNAQLTFAEIIGPEALIDALKQLQQRNIQN